MTFERESARNRARKFLRLIEPILADLELLEAMTGGKSRQAREALHTLAEGVGLDALPAEERGKALARIQGDLPAGAEPTSPGRVWLLMRGEAALPTAFDSEEAARAWAKKNEDALRLLDAHLTTQLVTVRGDEA